MKTGISTIEVKRLSENFIVQGVHSGFLFIVLINTLRNRSGFFDLVSLDRSVPNRVEKIKDVLNEKEYKRINRPIEIQND